MDFNFITILISLLAIFTFTLLIFSRQKKQVIGNLPPSPPRLPVIGNLHQLGKIPHRSLHKLSQKHGHVMLVKLGQIETLVVSSPSSAREVMKINDLDCCSRPYSHGTNKLSYNLLDIAFAPYTDYWKQMRKLCIIELFTAKRVKSFQHVRETSVSRMIDYLRQVNRSPVNLTEHIFDLTNSVIAQIAFGHKKFEGGRIFEECINEAMAMLSSFWAADFFPGFGSVLDRLMGQHKRLNRIFNEFDEFYEKAIEEHLNPTRLKSDHEDLIDILIGLSEYKTSDLPLTKDHIKAILMDILVGATDTSSVTMVWAMTELIRNPRVMKKVQTEIRSIIGKKKRVDETEVEKMNYLKMVVKETFRLHPPATLLIPRETMRHCKIGGYDVQPKTRIFVNVWSIGRDPKIWKNPEEFYPERFQNGDIDFRGQNFELLPFGAGRRICPGLHMGATAVEYTLANLLYHFNWELPDGMKKEAISVEEEVGLTVHKKIPLCLVPVKYE
jgi:cytochrome P450